MFVFRDKEATFENTTEETLETTKYNKTKQSSSKGVHSLMKNTQREKKAAKTKNNELEIKNTAMNAKLKVPKEKMSERDGLIRNENALLGTRTKVIKKPSQSEDYVM